MHKSYGFISFIPECGAVEKEIINACLNTTCLKFSLSQQLHQ